MVAAMSRIRGCDAISKLPTGIACVGVFASVLAPSFSDGLILGSSVGRAAGC
jgi:hypothetical protein